MLMALMTLSLATVIPLGYFLCTVSVLRTEVCPQNLWICDLTGQEEFCRCDQEWWDLEYAGGLPVITRVIAKEIPSFCVLSLTQGVTCKRCSVSLSEWTCVSRSLIVSRVDFYNSLRSSVTILSFFALKHLQNQAKIYLQTYEIIVGVIVCSAFKFQAVKYHSNSLLPYNSVRIILWVW